jgi:hypothetical protein
VVWAGWFERAISDAASALNVRLVRLGPDGTPQDAPVTIAGAVPAFGLLNLAASPLGVFAVWTESGGGNRRLQVRQFGPDGAAIGPGISRDLAPDFTSNGGLDIAAIDNPPGLVAGWAGYRSTDVGTSPSITWLTRMKCEER